MVKIENKWKKVISSRKSVNKKHETRFPESSRIWRDSYGNSNKMS